MVTITLNGKPREIGGAMTVTTLLEALDVKPQQVAVALNGEVVRRDDWPDTIVGDGDTVEVVRAVGGG